MISPHLGLPTSPTPSASAISPTLRGIGEVIHHFFDYTFHHVFFLSAIRIFIPQRGTWLRSALDHLRAALSSDVVDVLLGVSARPASGAGNRGRSHGGRPMASSTWDGSSEPVEQAEPVEAQMPFRSSISSRLSPSMHSMTKAAVPGRRLTAVAGQLTCAESWPARRRSAGRAGRVTPRRFSSQMLPSRARTASPRPTMPATFSVPAAAAALLPAAVDQRRERDAPCAHTARLHPWGR